MADKQITRKQAEASLAAVVAKFSGYLGGPANMVSDGMPQLMEDFDGRAWTIMWEEGPFEWTYNVSEDGPSEEESIIAADFGHTLTGTPAAKFPEGVFAEPINHYSLGLYPA